MSLARGRRRARRPRERRATRCFTGVSTDSRSAARRRPVRRAARRALRRPRLPQGGGGGAGRRGDGRQRLSRASRRCRRWWSTTRAAALGDLARYWRARFAPALVAVTGSNGKTTVKEMLAAILRSHAGEDGRARHARQPQQRHRPAAHAARAAPRAPLVRDRARHEPQGRDRLPRRHRAARRWRWSTTRSASTWSSCARSRRSRPRTRAVYDALPADGVAVINADDAHAGVLPQPRRHAPRASTSASSERRGHRRATARAACRARSASRTPAGEADATLAIPGLHNVRNALAAAACALRGRDRREDDRRRA